MPKIADENTIAARARENYGLNAVSEQHQLRDDPQFKPGDVVVLPSGGPQMTIRTIGTKAAYGEDWLEVVWFDEQLHFQGCRLTVDIVRPVESQTRVPVSDLSSLIASERERAAMIVSEGADLSIDALVAKIRSGQ